MDPGNGDKDAIYDHKNESLCHFAVPWCPQMQGRTWILFFIFKKNLSRLIFQLEISNRVSNSMVETYLQVNIKVSDIYATKF